MCQNNLSVHFHLWLLFTPRRHHVLRRRMANSVRFFHALVACGLNIKCRQDRSCLRDGWCAFEEKVKKNNCKANEIFKREKKNGVWGFDDGPQ